MDILDKFIQKLRRNKKRPSLRLVLEEQPDKTISKVSLDDKVDTIQLPSDSQSLDNAKYFTEQVNDAISSKLSDLPDWFVVGAIIRWLYLKKEITLLGDILRSREFADILEKAFEFGDEKRIEEMIERSSEVGFTYNKYIALIEWKWEFAVNEQMKLYYALKEIGEPASCEDIYEILNRNFPDNDLDPFLICNILQSDNEIFMLIGLNKYGLKKWNIENFQQDIEESLLHPIDETANKANDYDRISHSKNDVIDLPYKILSILEKAGCPLRAREIANELSDIEGIFVERKDINRCLYGPELKGYIKQDADYRWSITSIIIPTDVPQNLDAKSEETIPEAIIDAEEPKQYSNASTDYEQYPNPIMQPAVTSDEYHDVSVIENCPDPKGVLQNKNLETLNNQNIAEQIYHVGMRVKHAWLGEGTIVQMIDEYEKRKYKIEFQTGELLVISDETTLKPIIDIEELKQNAQDIEASTNHKKESNSETEPSNDSNAIVDSNIKICLSLREWQQETKSGKNSYHGGLIIKMARELVKAGNTIDNIFEDRNTFAIVYTDSNSKQYKAVYRRGIITTNHLNENENSIRQKDVEKAELFEHKKGSEESYTKSQNSNVKSPKYKTNTELKHGIETIKNSINEKQSAIKQNTPNNLDYSPEKQMDVLDSNTLRTGVKVKHRGLGEGIIVQVIDGYGRRQYEVDFKSGGRILITDETTIKIIANEEKSKQDSIVPLDHEKDSNSIITSSIASNGHNKPITQEDTENRITLTQNSNVRSVKRKTDFELRPEIEATKNSIDKKQSSVEHDTPNDLDYSITKQTDALDPNTFQVGAKVRHRGLGEGRVVQVIDGYGRKQYEIDFKSSGKILITDETTLKLIMDREESRQDSTVLVNHERSSNSIVTSTIASDESNNTDIIQQDAENQLTSEYVSQSQNCKTLNQKRLLNLCLIDLIENINLSESDLLDKLFEIPVSCLELPEPILRDLRSNNIFPDDGLDSLACCTIGYLLKLSNGKSWVEAFISHWQKLFKKCFPVCICRDIIPLARKECFSLSDFSVPRDLGYLPLGILGLNKQSIDFFNNLKILNVSNLENFAEIDLFKRSDNVDQALQSLCDLNSSRLYITTENWNMIVDFFNKPMDIFLADSLSNVSTSSRNLEIFLAREGFFTSKEPTLEEIANQYGLTRERVRQIVEGVNVRIKSAKNSGRLDFSPIVRMISNIVCGSGGMLNLPRFAEMIHWNASIDLLLRFLKFILDIDNSDLILKNNILSIRSQNNTISFLKALEEYFKEINELKTIEELLNIEFISVMIKEFGMELSTSTFADCINMSDIIGVLPDGRVGLREWRWAFPHTKRDKIQYVLKNKGLPMHYTEIHTELQRLFPVDDFENVKAIHAALGVYKEIFCLVDRGTFALREWNSEPYVSVGDAIEIVLKQSGTPISFSDIFERISLIGEYSYSNIRLALTRNSFTRVGLDLWDLSEKSILDKERKGKEEIEESDIHPLVINLVKRLKDYGYKPLILDECIQLCHDLMLDSGNPGKILDCITKCKYLKIHEYGNTYVGLSTWKWFALDGGVSNMTQQTNLVEWYLRMTNKPADADIISDGILDIIGNYRLTAYDVANACEKNSRRFQLDENGNYSLYLWEDAPKYKDAIEEILKSGEFGIEYIVSHLSNTNQDNNETILATLYLYEDIFTEAEPFIWKIKENEEFDYTKIDFDDLKPDW